jgi:small-conductance mechanosensitive channel
VSDIRTHTVQGIFAFGSVGTLAFTLASKDLVTQFVSGFFLSASDKMYVGDSVNFGDGTSGKVLKVGWMNTLMRNSDNTVTTIPNSMLANQKITNMSRLTQSQVKQVLRFHYRDADVLPDVLETIKTEIRAACPKLLEGVRPFRVFWTGYKDDHLEVVVDTHHAVAPLGDAYWILRQRLLMAIHRAVQKHGIELNPLYTSPDTAEPEWRVLAKQEDLATKSGARDLEEDELDTERLLEKLNG